MATAAHPLHRSHHAETFEVPLQRPSDAGVADRVAVSQALADRVALQVDEAASAHQSVFRNHAECGEDAVVGCRDCFAVDSSPQAPTFADADTQRNRANPERYALRENTYKSGLSRRTTAEFRTAESQPVAIIRLVTGH